MMNILSIILIILLCLSGFLIVWAMVGYGLSLKIISKIIKIKAPSKSVKKQTVTLMIVAHNEEKVIYDKLNNAIDNDYPKDKIKYLIASDNSNDGTNKIVENFITEHPECDIKLYVTKDHKGKTNAQNEAQKIVDSEILVMTDANSMFEKNAISELVSYFTDDNIAYVCGALLYKNTENLTANSESSYWDSELSVRKIESDLQTITAGNGAIYACRNKDYIDFKPIYCHDSMMPFYYSTHKKRALFNPNAIAFEKAGETTQDEFKRKVRMNRTIITDIFLTFKTLNIFKHKWFSYFYYGHRTCRYTLWLNHIIAFISNLLLIFFAPYVIFHVLFALQILFYLLGFLGKYTHNKLLHMVYYYCITILAQFVAVFKCITGKSKPVWEKAESTR